MFLFFRSHISTSTTSFIFCCVIEYRISGSLERLRRRQTLVARSRDISKLLLPPPVVYPSNKFELAATGKTTRTATRRHLFLIRSRIDGRRCTGNDFNFEHTKVTAPVEYPVVRLFGVFNGKLFANVFFADVDRTRLIGLALPSRRFYCGKLRRSDKLVCTAEQ